MNNAIPTPRQTFTLNFSQQEIEDKIKYISDEIPIYKYLDKNDTLNSIRVEATKSFQPQHLDIRFQNTDESTTTFEIEVSKHTGGMTNDDSSLYAKQNLDEFMGFLTKCLQGGEITEEDKKSLKSAQNKNMIMYGVITVVIIWFFLGGGLEMVLGL